MVFPATDAATLTSTTISSVNTADVQIEITLAENKIRLASANELYSISYDATVIGNPTGNPQVTANLTSNQLSFYTLLVNAGYRVGIDILTGRWRIDWAPQGPETEVQIYSFRTTLAPGAIHTATVNAITAYFATLTPIVHCVAVSDGDIDESQYGGVSSTSYEYTAVVDQGVDTADHSTALTTYISGQSLGYNSGNCKTYKLV